MKILMNAVDSFAIPYLVPETSTIKESQQQEHSH